MWHDFEIDQNIIITPPPPPPVPIELAPQKEHVVYDLMMLFLCLSCFVFLVLLCFCI